MLPRVVVAGTDCSVTRLGFGCARLHGGGELGASGRLLEAALEAGVRHFDTAPSYGGGLSENVLGDVLAGVADVTIATKIGIPRPPADAATARAGGAYRRVLRPILSRFPVLKTRLLALAGRTRSDTAVQGPVPTKRRLERDEVLRGLEDSLSRLKRDSVDLYLVHDPDQFELTDELRDVFDGLRRSGAIRAFGLAFTRVADLGTGFGTVAQGKIALGTAASPSPNETRIFHGALRHGWLVSKEARRSMTPGAWLERLLRENPDVVVIFSASEPHQVRTILDQFDAARVG